MTDPLGGLSEQPEPAPQPAPQKRPFTPSTYLLLAVLAAFFAAEGLLGHDPAVESGYALVRLGALYAPALRDGDWWRIGSYAFLHIGWVHIASNSWSLWALMRDLEILYGSNVSLGLFCATAIAGGVASTAWHVVRGGTAVLAAGASGGLFGLFGATVAVILMLWPRLTPQARRGFLRMLGLNVLVIGYIALRFPVDNAAHAGGFLSGVAFGLVAPLRNRPERPWHRAVQVGLIGCALALAALEGAAVAWAVHPRPRTLRAAGVEAQAPGVLLPLGSGVVGIPGECLLGIAAEKEPLQIEPGEDAVHIGGRTWVRERSNDKGADMTRLAAADGGGRVVIELWCGAQFCRGAAGEKLYEQVARTFKVIR